MTVMPNSLNIKTERIDQISDIATTYVSKDKSLLDYFIHSYYQSLHHEIADEISDADLAGMGLHHFTLLKAYDGSQPQLKIINPVAEEQHFHSSHTVIQIVAHDRPFLVDTLLMSLEEQGLDIHRIYNIILSVERDDTGRVSKITNAPESATTNMSLIHCEISYQDNDNLVALQQVLMDKIDTLDVVVEDWAQMQQRLSDIKAEMTQQMLPQVYYSKEEIQAFLAWIADDNFIFLGFREYRLERYSDTNNINNTNKNNNHAKHTACDLDLIAIGNSGLGVLRGSDTDMVTECFR